VSSADLGFEFLLNILRLPDGFTAVEFASRTGLDFATQQAGLAAAVKMGLLDRDDDTWRPTELGFRHLNELQAQFLPC
jgi:oxygen-independent coproporphyrinogen-3 oxidase